MTTSPDEPERVVVVDASDPSPGRFDPARFRNPVPNDADPYPEITEEDRAATRAELDELRRRMTRKTA
jgi:hypothetical protein